ncbi:MAG: HAMP domain-containing sensor histidine kinase [Hyphomicrobium sp.]|nr:HAMP domain-containing sensor histidine kinase [Hyphomicrobium sp.]
MTQTPRRAPHTPIPESLAAEIRDAPSVVLAIALERAEVVAASAGARRFFGYDDALGTASLDAEMPAVRTLRALARGTHAGGAEPAPVALVFWARGQVVPVVADVAFTVSDTGRTSLAIVRAGDTDPRADDMGPQARRTTPDKSHIEPNPDVSGRWSAGVADAQPMVEPENMVEPKNETGGLEGRLADEGAPEPQLQSSMAEASTPFTLPADVAAEPLGRAKLAHELKTPIGAIATAAEIMADARFGPLGDARYQAYAADMLANARHALTLIDRMLARKPSAEAKSPPAVLERFELNPLVASAVATVRDMANAKQVEIALALADAEPVIAADATSVRQIALNLLTNAIKFTPSGGHVAVATLAASSGGAVLRIQDTGPGMSAREIADALKPKADLNIDAHRPGGGLGLGLPLVKSLAEALGADLDIESAVGGGTCVSVRFQGGRLIVV